MLLEMVRASIRKEMAPVFGGSITLLVNRHRFPLYAISLEIVTPYVPSFLSRRDRSSPVRPETR